MRRWLTLAATVGGLAAASGVPAADLRSAMGVERFRAAGLHKLSSSELAALQAWLDEADAGQPAAQESGSEPGGGVLQRFGLRPSEATAEPEAIEARIDGEFKGWSGRTLFRLDNGQVWQQRTRDRYYKRLDSPAVRISRGTMGYRLELIETGAGTGVKRLR